MAMQMRVRERKGGDVAGACVWRNSLVWMRRERAKESSEHVSWRGWECKAFRRLQLVGTHDDALRVGRSSEL